MPKDNISKYWINLKSGKIKTAGRKSLKSKTMGNMVINSWLTYATKELN